MKVAIAAGEPVISAKNRELVGDFRFQGRGGTAGRAIAGRGWAERAVARRLDRLPPDARDALLIAAQMNRTRARRWPRHCARGLGETAFAPAERAGLVAITDGRIRFSHPLVRSVVYQSASGEQRRAAHAALAAASDETADWRPWHAATGPDEEIAAAVENAANRAAARGGLATAARTYERAGGLTPRSDARGLRLLAAATLGHATGRLAWAAEPVLAGQPLANTAAIRADFQQLAATVERQTGLVSRARAMLWDNAAAIADEDPTRATLMLIDATPAEAMSGDLAPAAESAQRALEQARSCSSAIQQMAGAVANVVASLRGLLPADQVQIEALRGTVASLPELPATAGATIGRRGMRCRSSPGTLASIMSWPA